MIASVQKAAVLGSPPVCYTIQTEMNIHSNVAKTYVNYHKSNWVELVNNMHELITE